MEERIEGCRGDDQSEQKGTRLEEAGAVQVEAGQEIGTLAQL